MVDFTGKLNNHKDYINFLEKIKEKCEYIEIVVIDGRKSNDLVNEFKEDILDIKKTSEWWGTKTNKKNNLYKIKCSEKIFIKLKTYDTFCKYSEYGTTSESLIKGDYAELTNFGIDDIAFYDSNDNCLLCTTTHEGYIFIDKNIL